MSDTYSVVITGNLIPGFDLESVQSSLSELFKINQEKVKLYLSGNPNVLKRDADRQTAAKYKAKIEQLGASVELHNSSSASKETQEAVKTINTPKLGNKTQKVVSGKNQTRIKAPRQKASRQSVVDKMLQPSDGVNLIERGRIKQKRKMEKIQITKQPVGLLPMILGILCVLIGSIDLVLSYLEILNITNLAWSSIISIVIGSVLVKSSFEN